jgi:hypothetical protein
MRILPKCGPPRGVQSHAGDGAYFADAASRFVMAIRRTVTIPGRKATHFRNIPAMGHHGYRASGFSVRYKFMTDTIQAKLQNV